MGPAADLRTFSNSMDGGMVPVRKGARTPIRKNSMESAVLLSQLFPKPEDVSELRPGLFVYDSTACCRYELLFAKHRDWDFVVDYPVWLALRWPLPVR